MKEVAWIRSPFRDIF